MNIRIRNDVGLNAINEREDVMTIQRLLAQNGFTNLAIDGFCGPKTIRAIFSYQQNIMRNPDSVVSVNGETLFSLRTSHGVRQAQQRDNDSRLTSSSQSQPINTQDVINVANLTLSIPGARLLESLESLRLTPYDDQTQQGVSTYIAGATIGYGHLITNKAEFDRLKNGITQSQADVLFRQDHAFAEQGVKRYVKVNLTQNQYDALVYLTYNIGAGIQGNPSKKKGLAPSTLLKIINGEEEGDLDAQWRSYSHSQGRFSRGVLNRRNCELNIYNNGVYARW